MEINFSDVKVGTYFKSGPDLYFKIVNVSRCHGNADIHNAVFIDGLEVCKGVTYRFLDHNMVTVDKHPDAVKFSELKDGDRFKLIVTYPRSVVTKDTVFQKIKTFTSNLYRVNAIYWSRSDDVSGVTIERDVEVIKLKYDNG